MSEIVWSEENIAYEDGIIVAKIIPHVGMINNGKRYLLKSEILTDWYANISDAKKAFNRIWKKKGRKK